MKRHKDKALLIKTLSQATGDATKSPEEISHLAMAISKAKATYGLPLEVALKRLVSDGVIKKFADCFLVMFETHSLLMKDLSKSSATDLAIDRRRIQNYNKMMSFIKTYDESSSLEQAIEKLC